MKKVMAMLLALLSLCGCGGGEETAEDLLQRYESMESCSMEAVVSCEYFDERREYTLRCDYNAEGESTVTVLKPVGLQGISIRFDGEKRQVLYEDIVLDAGTIGESRLSPVEILPRMMDAVKNGWLLEENTEEMNGEALWRMTFEVEENGVKQYWTLLFDEKTGIPLAAELTEDSRLFFTMEFTNFKINDIINQSKTE